ncbi:hypothetical protein VNI00_010618 [Paramarasmius palmivorus]|uniref:Uncharacterized protein n=1 Tax=Paramarasmius palmivorus TaxID=297713 RepID=A0AAW0CM29_9AGAR
MKPFALLFLALTSTVGDAFGRSHANPHSGDHNYRKTRLIPTRHPEHDAADVVHLRPADSLAFHYHDPTVPYYLRRSFATMHVGGFNAPAVNLENSDRVISVKCENDRMVIRFSDDEARDTAVREWSTPSQLIMITYHNECGEGMGSGQRSYHLVSGMTPGKDEHQILFEMSTVPFEEAVHPHKDITIDVTGYQVDPNSNARPIHLSRRGDKPDPSTINDAFDNSLDNARGYDDPTRNKVALEDLFSASSRIEKWNLAKRFEWGCIAVLSPFTYFTMLAFNKDPCPSITKPTFDAIKAAEEAIVKFFKKEIKPILDKLIQFFEESSKILAQVLSSRGWNPAGTAIFDTNVTVPMKYTEEFGSAYKVYTLEKSKEKKTHSGDATATARLDVYCVGCRVNGFIEYEAHFKFTAEKFKFSAARVRIIDGVLQFEVGVGAIFDINIEGSLAEVDLPSVPLSPLVIPGLLTVGPFISPAVGADWELGATGSFIARVGFGWKNVNLFIDFLDIMKSQAEAWTPLETRPTFAASVAGRATLSPYFSTTLNIGIDLLNGKFKAAAGLEAKASVPLSVELDASTEKGVGSEDCAGAVVSMDFDVELAFTLTGGKSKGKPFGQLEYKPLSMIFPLTKCVPLPGAKALSPIVPAPPLPASAVISANKTAALNGSAPDVTLQKITSDQTSRGTFQILWQPADNNLYVVPSSHPVIATSEGMGSLLFVTKKGRLGVASSGTADGRFFHIYDEIVLGRARASRIRLADKHKVPKGTIIVTLRSDVIEDKPVLRAVIPDADLNKGIGIYPVVSCLYQDPNRLPKLFVVRGDIESGISELMKTTRIDGGSKTNSIEVPPLKNANFEACFLLPFKFG